MTEGLFRALAFAALGSCATRGEAIGPGKAPAVAVTADRECRDTGRVCGRFGQRGECVLGRCVLGGGLCSQDIDCDDGNSCTFDRCELGKCAQVMSASACTLEKGGGGQCLDGFCEARYASIQCFSIGDCPAAVNNCREATCDNGHCAVRNRKDTESCEFSSGRKGSCASGRCLPPTLEAVNAQRCQTVFDDNIGYYERCSRSLSFSLSPDEIKTEEDKLSTRIAKDYRYDLKVTLVELPDGGYNIVAHNRKGAGEFQGLCDPSFIAWAVADFSQSTNWKSRNLHVWLKSYSDGWGLPTARSREAVRHARANSGLGWLGVLNAPAFRAWLEKEFSPLKPAPMGASEEIPIAPSAGASRSVPPPPEVPLQPSSKSGLSSIGSVLSSDVAVRSQSATGLQRSQHQGAAEVPAKTQNEVIPTSKPKRHHQRQRQQQSDDDLTEESDIAESPDN